MSFAGQKVSGKDRRVYFTQIDLYCEECDKLRMKPVTTEAANCKKQLWMRSWESNVIVLMERTLKWN